MLDEEFGSTSGAASNKRGVSHHQCFRRSLLYKITLNEKEPDGKLGKVYGGVKVSGLTWLFRFLGNT